MQRNNPMFLAGPGGRFDLANPATQQMVRHVSANPADAPRYGASLAEIFQLQKMLERMATPMPKPQTMTVYDELKNAALQQASGGMLGQPQMQQAPQMPQAPQQAPQQPMAEGGLTSLPVYNFDPANYAGGGIVAFEKGGLTDEEARAAIMAASPVNQYSEPDDTTSLGRFRAMQNELENIRSQYANQPDVDIRDLYAKAGIAGELGATRQKQLEALKAQEPERRQDALRNFLMTTGFGMAAAAAQPGVPRSGGILGALTQPLSVGAAQAAPGYLAEQKELRNLMTQRDKELAELENQRRAEARGDVRVNQEFKDKKEARLERLDEKIISVRGSMASALGQQEAARAGRQPTDLSIVANTHLEAQRAQGDKRPDAVIKREGITNYVRDKAAYDPRYAGIASTASTAASGQDVQLRREASDFVQAQIQKYPHNLQIMTLQEQDRKNAEQGRPTALAQEYEDKLYAAALRRVRQSPGSAVPAAAPAVAPAAPAAAPMKRMKFNAKGELVTE